MVRQALAFVLASTVVGCALAQGTAPQYGQCGGKGWTGATTCPSGWTCTVSNEWYSQCLPGGPTNPPVTTQPPVTTTPGQPPVTTTAPGGAIPTLQPGWNFIRAVTSPNFHKYLQSQTTGQPSDAILGEANRAAQFQITSGQLIQSQPGGNLYAIVEPRTDSSAKMLKVSWSTTPDTLGQFKFSGDTVEWSSSSVSRPQTNAWLICDSGGAKKVFINLGAYGYQTPAGCNDHTIHGFTGTTPD